MSKTAASTFGRFGPREAVGRRHRADGETATGSTTNSSTLAGAATFSLRASFRQPICSDRAIRTCLLPRAAFKLPQRQAEGLMLSVVKLLRCELAIHEPSGLRRACGALSWTGSGGQERWKPLFSTLVSCVAESVLCRAARILWACFRLQLLRTSVVLRH